MAEDLDGIVIGSGDGADSPPPFKMPSKEELLAAVEKMTLSDEDRQKLIDNIVGRENFGDQIFGGQATPKAVQRGQNISVELLMLLSMITILLLIFVGNILSPMNNPKALKLKQLLDVVSKFQPDFKELVAKKIQTKREVERIKFLCTVTFALWTLVFLMAVAFFGYKLYKSLVERERRREEKKRQKLQKKKK